MDNLRTRTESKCLTCQEPVSKGFARIFGDRDDQVHRCQNCDTFGRLKRGTAAGIEVSQPDPLDNSGRMPDTPEIPDGQRSHGGSSQ